MHFGGAASVFEVSIHMDCRFRTDGGPRRGRRHGHGAAHQSDRSGQPVTYGSRTPGPCGTFFAVQRKKIIQVGEGSVRGH